MTTQNFKYEFEQAITNAGLKSPVLTTIDDWDNILLISVDSNGAISFFEKSPYNVKDVKKIDSKEEEVSVFFNNGDYISISSTEIKLTSTDKTYINDDVFNHWR